MVAWLTVLIYSNSLGSTIWSQFIYISSYSFCPRWRWNPEIAQYPERSGTNSMHSANVQHTLKTLKAILFQTIITNGKCVAHMRNQTENLSCKMYQCKKKDVFLNLFFFLAKIQSLLKMCCSYLYFCQFFRQQMLWYWPSRKRRLWPFWDTKRGVWKR